jgi:ribosomal-protein-alanine N-acetyltransferase
VIVVERLRPAHLPQVMEHEPEAFGAEAWTIGMYREELADSRGRHYLGAFEVPGPGEPAATPAPAAMSAPAATSARSAAGGADRRPLRGWAGVLVSDRTAQILTIAVVAAARRRGIGSMLMDGLLREARRRRAVEVLLEVRVDNHQARAMYAGYGFVEIGVRRGYYQQTGADAAVLRLPLGR